MILDPEDIKRKLLIGLGCFVALVFLIGLGLAWYRGRQLDAKIRTEVLDDIKHDLPADAGTPHYAPDNPNEG